MDVSRKSAAAEVPYVASHGQYDYITYFMDIVVFMEIVKFKNEKRGTIYKILLDSYSDNIELSKMYSDKWSIFDNFVYDNIKIMNENGFYVKENEEIIGFISWDSRKLPDIIQIGHNCIIKKYKGKGRGRAQLQLGINEIIKLNPKKIIVRTGNINYFIPAQKMYESIGFIKSKIITINNTLVNELIEYILVLS